MKRFYSEPNTIIAIKKTKKTFSVPNNMDRIFLHKNTCDAISFHHHDMQYLRNRKVPNDHSLGSGK